MIVALGFDEAVVLELTHERGLSARPLTELVERDELLLEAPPDVACRRLLAVAPPATRGRQLLADHAQRQELVPLQTQDRAEPLDVFLGEQPVAAVRAAQGQQPLLLE